jgi:hypothetical protein
MMEMIALGVVYYHQKSSNARCAAQHRVRIAVEFCFAPLLVPLQVFAAEAD